MTKIEKNVIGTKMVPASDEGTQVVSWTPDGFDGDRQLEIRDRGYTLTLNRSRGTADTLFVSVNTPDGDMLFRVAVDRTTIMDADPESFPWKVKADLRVKNDSTLGTGGYTEMII